MSVAELIKLFEQLLKSPWETIIFSALAIILVFAGWYLKAFVTEKGKRDANKETGKIDDSLKDKTVGRNTKIAGGEEAVTLDIVLELYKEPNSFVPDNSIRDSFSTSWNKLFAIISPLLVDEASDIKFKKALDRFVSEQCESTLIEKHPECKHLTHRIILSSEDFKKIKIQFLGLQLISISTRMKTRNKSDQNSYWMLTPRGELAMTSLIAIEKGRLST